MKNLHQVISLRNTPRGLNSFLLGGIGGAYLLVLGLFTFLATDISHFPGEQSFTLWLLSIETSWLDEVMRAISVPGFQATAIPIIVVTLAFLFIRGRRRESALVLLAILLAGGVIALVKEIVSRPRPMLDGLDAISGLGGSSFPSGHVTHYVVFLGTLVFVMTWRMKPCLRRHLIHGVLAVALMAVGISRVYLGAHWLGDVVAGYAFGVAVVAVVVGFGRWWLRDNTGALDHRLREPLVK